MKTAGIPVAFRRSRECARWSPPALRSLFPAVCCLLVAAWCARFSPTATAQVPGPELFAKDPKTPLELWDAVDYLVRTGQVKKALPYLDRFMKSRPDDATWVAVRNRFGLGSVLRLYDDPATRPFAAPIAKNLAEAAQRYATRPDRIARYMADLTGTPEEQDFGIRHLQEAGPFAVPAFVSALGRPDISAEERALLSRNLSRLDRSAIPPLIATLDSPDPAVATAAASALGAIGDPRAVPFLTFPAGSAEAAPAVRLAAQAAIERLTRKPFFTQERTPTQTLAAAAWAYHRHQVEFSEDPVVVWTWDKAQKTPVAKNATPSEVESMAGLRLAREALRLDPTNRDAQVAQISLALEKSVERAGYEDFASKDKATFAAATATGPSILADVLKTAIADRKTDLAAAATQALGQVTDPAALRASGTPHPLVDALFAPGRRLQMAAATALVNLAPTAPFPGSSRIVPTLARFVVNQSLPRAVVIDGNPNRGSQVAGFLNALGYDSELELTGSKGFRAAAESADVEVILVSFDLFRSGWGLPDTLANLEADARTARIPVFVYGPLDLTYKKPNLPRNYPGVRYMVTPTTVDNLKGQLTGLPPALTEGERAGYARQAAALLAKIAADGKGPLVLDLAAAEPALSVALAGADASEASAKALGDVPDPDAQRSLAGLVLDPSRPAPLRTQTALELVRSIRRFGPLISSDQETRLASILREETDPNVRASLETIVRALTPTPAVGSARPPARPRPAPDQEPAQTAPPLDPKRSQGIQS